MSRAVLDLLAARLRAPPPRVRWAAARELAQLIRGGDAEASSALLAWLGACELESEAVTAVGVIHAFHLGPHFDAVAVAEAVAAPSLLSDWQLRQAFPGARPPAREYASAPHTRPALPPHQGAWFREGLGVAVPLRLVEPIRYLARDSGTPLMALWRHEWAWLQATLKAPPAAFPHFFMGDTRGWTGAFDLRQRELYVSSYLRMLGVAVARLDMPREMAEAYALTALSFSPGLADLQPRPRPTWTQGLAATEAEGLQDLCRRLIAAAAAELDHSESLLALHAGDFAENSVLDIDIRRVLEPADGPADGPADDPEHLGLLIVAEPTGMLTGAFGPDADAPPPPIAGPVDLVQPVWPQYTGSVHGELVARMRLASPDLFGCATKITADADGVRLEAAGQVFSRWRYWLSEWDAGHPTAVQNYVGSLTTVATAALEARLAAGALRTSWRVEVTRAARTESYGELDKETLLFRFAD